MGLNTCLQMLVFVNRALSPVEQLLNLLKFCPDPFISKGAGIQYFYGVVFHNKITIKLPIAVSINTLLLKEKQQTLHQKDANMTSELCLDIICMRLLRKVQCRRNPQTRGPKQKIVHKGKEHKRSKKVAFRPVQCTNCCCCSEGIGISFTFHLPFKLGLSKRIKRIRNCIVVQLYFKY